jgi:UPF0755 protein
MKKMNPVKKFFLIFFIIAVLLGALAGIDFYLKVYTPFKEYKETITVQIKNGASVSAVGRLLYREKIISSYNYFRLYHRLFLKDASVKSGEYLFDRPMTIPEIFDKLIEGRVVLHKITIKEGLTLREIAEVIEQQRGIRYDEFVRAAGDTSLIRDLDPGADDLEGYLYPDTYHIRRETTAEEMVHLMVDKFKDNFTNSMKWRADQLGMSIREIVTLASLIEKETAARDERFLISSVFHNRLKLGMPMGCDPTVIYALKRDNLYRGKLGWKDLKYDSPYNTRLYKDLPPGPICNPGYASIEAALFPENTGYLYFVAKNSQSHYFSKTLQEHNWAVKKYIINKNRD